MMANNIVFWPCQLNKGLQVVLISMEFKDLTNQVLLNCMKIQHIYIFKALQLKQNDKLLKHKMWKSASFNITVILIKPVTTWLGFRVTHLLTIWVLLLYK